MSTVPGNYDGSQTPSQSSAPATPRVQPRALRPGAVAGIVIAAVVVAAGFGAYFALMWRRTRARQAHSLEAGTPPARAARGRRKKPSSKRVASPAPLCIRPQRAAGKRSARGKTDGAVLPVYAKFATQQIQSKPSAGASNACSPAVAPGTPSTTFTSVVASASQPFSDGDSTPRRSVSPARPLMDGHRPWSQLFTPIDERDEA